MLNIRLQYELEKIERLFPGKIRLNKTQMLKCIGKGNNWFDIRVNENRLSELPEFPEPKLAKRKSIPYPLYSFDTFKVAEFNAI